MQNVWSRQGVILRRPAAALIALVLTVFAVIPSSGRAQEGDSGAIRPVGKLVRLAPDAIAAFGDKIIPPGYDEPVGSPNRGIRQEMATTGTILIVHEARQLWQFFPFADFSPRTGVIVRDLDTLAPKHSFVYPGRFKRSTSLNGGEWTHALDAGKRLFLVDLDIMNVIEFDLQTFASRKISFGPPWVTGTQRNTAFNLAGITYDQTTGEIVLVHGGVPKTVNVANAMTWLDLRTGASKIRFVRSCNGAQPSIETGTTYSMNPLLLAGDVYLPCHRGGNVGAIARIPRASLFDPQGPEDVAVGPVSVETSFVDPATGRLFLMTALGEIWAFDSQTMSYIGVVSASGDAKSSISASFGIDPVSGRLFFLSPTYGVGVAEGRFFPLPQARLYSGLRSIAQERIWSDAKTGRFFVLAGTDLDKAQDYIIFNAGLAPTPPAAPDPDRNTLDAAEGLGTEARYFGSVSGYGVRALMAKGLVTIPPAPTAGVQAPTAMVINDHVNSRCGYTDRELVAGRVAKAEYDTGSSAATAIAVDVDERTKQDLLQFSRCDVTARDRDGNEVFAGIFSTSPVALPDKGKEWKYEPASCSASDGGDRQSESGENYDDPALGSSQVVCPLSGGKLEASASADLLTGGVKVGYAGTNVEIQKIPGSGIVSKATSVARNIDIAGVIQIAEVFSTATSTANGRPAKKDMSEYTTAIKGVVLNGQHLCGDSCDTRSVLDMLNQAAVGRVQFRAAIGLDDGLRKGSAKGASTAVQKSPQRQASDQALIGDFTNEVPGLEMTFYNDNVEFGRARQVYQFAGVASAATYNVMSKPTGVGFEGGDDVLDSAIGSDINGGGSVFGPLPVDNRPAPDIKTISNDDDGPVRRFITAIGRGIRLFFEDPRQMALLFTAWALFGLPVALARRRRLLASVANS